MKWEIEIDFSCLGETVKQLMENGITFTAKQSDYDKTTVFITCYSY